MTSFEGFCCFHNLLTFLNINMPDLNGMELAQIIDRSDKKKACELFLQPLMTNIPLKALKSGAELLTKTF